MAMRLQELHPSLVHFPLALLPVTLAADVAARLTGNERLSWLGRWGMVASAASAAISGIAGLIAQEEVNVEGASLDTLITHRNLNLAVVGLTSGLAARRLGVERPGAGYLAAGVATLAALVYSGYLGGEVVYRYGAGVEPADGLYDGGGPEMTAANASRVVRSAARHLGQGVKHLAQETASGKLAPSLFAAPNGDGAKPEPSGARAGAAAAREASPD